MPFPPPRPPCVLASVLAAAGIMLAVAGCSHITPLGPDAAATLPPPRHLGSPMIVQVMRSRPPGVAHGCPAGWVTVSMPPGAPATPCYRPIGKPVTITSATVSSVSTFRPGPPPGQPCQGQPCQPTQYGFTVTVPAADAAAVTAVIRQAYDSGGAVGISVAGKLWQAPQVRGPFPGQHLQITLLSRNQAFQLYRILVPSG
jgi:hypothetical protein